MRTVDYRVRFCEIVGNGFIDMEATGKKLQEVIYEKGYTVKEIQEQLGFTGPNSIYRWFKGKALPTLDHMYELSYLFGMHMEDLLVPYRKEKDDGCMIEIVKNTGIENRYKRIDAYCKMSGKYMLD